MDNDKELSCQDHIDCVSDDGRPFTIDLCSILSMPIEVRGAYFEELGYYTTDGINWKKRPTDG